MVSDQVAAAPTEQLRGNLGVDVLLLRQGLLRLALLTLDFLLNLPSREYSLNSPEARRRVLFFRSAPRRALS